MSTPNPTNSLLDRSGALQLGLTEWNEKKGETWGFKAQWSPEGWAKFTELENAIFDGKALHLEPGPFKYLGALCVFLQYTPFFELLDHNGKPVDDNTSRLWLPRIAVWLPPYYASVLTYNNAPLPLMPRFISAHMLVDFIGYLRSLRGTVISLRGKPLPKDLIVERTLLTGLIIEAAAYSANSPSPQLEAFMKLSAVSLRKLSSEEKADIATYDPDCA